MDPQAAQAGFIQPAAGADATWTNGLKSWQDALAAASPADGLAADPFAFARSAGDFGLTSPLSGVSSLTDSSSSGGTGGDSFDPTGARRNGR
jgi:hypothetical protein